MTRFLGRFSSIVCALLVGSSGLLPSQEAAMSVDKVRFVSADGVTLHGTFYRGPKTAPIVLMLHNVGGDDDSGKKNWVELATELQSTFSVFTFDFRGHGQSTKVDSNFAKFPLNQSCLKGGLKKDTTEIDHKLFMKSHYSLFINDIAAAKSYLEGKNDKMLCNTQRFIVIGAEQGATLGAIWANSEFYRYNAVIKPSGIYNILTPENLPEGKYFSAFVWLSMADKLGDRMVNVLGQLMVPAKVNQIPTVFVNSDKDVKGIKLAKSLEKGIKGAGSKKEDAKSKLTGTFEVAVGDPPLMGHDLLLKKLNTPAQIHKWLKSVIAEGAEREWAPRDFQKSFSVWRMSPTAKQYLPARVMLPNQVVQGLPTPSTKIVSDAEDKNIVYDSYFRFWQ